MRDPYSDMDTTPVAYKVRMDRAPHSIIFLGSTSCFSLNMVVSADLTTRQVAQKDVWGNLQAQNGQSSDLLFGNSKCTLGRSPSCIIHIPQEQISKYSYVREVAGGVLIPCLGACHAVIEWDGRKRLGSASLKDQQSTNGTWLNGWKLNPEDHKGAPLRHGDVITFGDRTAIRSDDICLSMDSTISDKSHLQYGYPHSIHVPLQSQLGG
jgi:hypothetical protein